MDKSQTILAIILAPLSSLLVVLFMFVEKAFRSPDGFGDGSIIIVILFLLGFVSTSFTFVVLVGLPFHYLFYKLGVRTPLVYCVVGATVAVLYQYATGMVPPTLTSTGYWVYLASGLLVSFTFWRVSVKNARK